jgi:hypothetical protein
MSSVSAAKQLNDLLDELDEDTLAKMSDEEVMEMRKQLNPYGRTIEGSDQVLTYSYTDLRGEYQKKLMLTTMVGFLNRMLDEWNVPDGVPVIPVYDYVKDPASLDTFEKGLNTPATGQLKEDINANAVWMAKRVIVKEFLEDMFQYNPDFHVRSAYKPAPLDDERKIIDTPAGMLAINELKRKDPEFRESLLKFERLKLAESKAVDAKADARAGTKDVQKKATDALTDASEAKVAPETAVVSAVRAYTTEMIPPADIFHRYQYYYDSNYEEMRGIVQDLYCDKPDLETAINPYCMHASEDAADAFIDKHKDEVITTIFKAHTGKWNIFAPFKKVRESMRYFNKKTIVLEEIAKQIERDAKLGKDLMEKRVKVKKVKNITRDGPDDPAFAKWKANNSTLSDMGATDVNNVNSKASDECPDDAIQVDVFRLSKGGQTMEKTKFFTQAEAPDVQGGPGAEGASAPTTKE